MAEIEYDEKLVQMADEQNRPFKGKEAWKKRQPRCPNCDAVLKASRKSIRVREFRDQEFETCLKGECEPKDHLYRGKSKVFRCSKCDSPDTYAGHPSEMTIHLRCKCVLDPEDEEQWNMMAAQVHMMRTHGMDRHGFVQHLFDSLRPEPLLVNPGQKLLVIGPPMPDSA